MEESERPKRWCPKGKHFAFLDEFGPNNGRKDKLHLWCKECARKHARAYRKATYNLEEERGKVLARNYKGFSEEKYQELLSKQGGVCAVCGMPETLFLKKREQAFRLAVDHDHETDEVRALLCFECNTSLGLLHEDPERIEALLAYARRIQKQGVS